jgi:hypothetical protein
MFSYLNVIYHLWFFQLKLATLIRVHNLSQTATDFPEKNCTYGIHIQSITLNDKMWLSSPGDVALLAGRCGSLHAWRCDSLRREMWLSWPGDVAFSCNPSYWEARTGDGLRWRALRWNSSDVIWIRTMALWLPTHLMVRSKVGKRFKWWQTGRRIFICAHSKWTRVRNLEQSNQYSQTLFSIL